MFKKKHSYQLSLIWSLSSYVNAPPNWTGSVVAQIREVLSFVHPSKVAMEREKLCFSRTFDLPSGKERTMNDSQCRKVRWRYRKSRQTIAHRSVYFSSILPLTSKPSEMIRSNVEETGDSFTLSGIELAYALSSSCEQQLLRWCSMTKRWKSSIPRV